MTSEKDLIHFITYINKLDPIEFAGISKVLCVSVFDKEKKIRPYEEILSDLIDNFCRLGRKQKREILRLLQKVAKNPSTFPSKNNDSK